MCQTGGEEVVEEINVAVMRLLEEGNEHINDDEINMLIHTKTQEYVHSIEEV